MLIKLLQQLLTKKPTAFYKWLIDYIVHTVQLWHTSISALNIKGKKEDEGTRAMWKVKCILYIDSVTPVVKQSRLHRDKNHGRFYIP